MAHIRRLDDCVAIFEFDANERERKKRTKFVYNFSADVKYFYSNGIYCMCVVHALNENSISGNKPNTKRDERKIPRTLTTPIPTEMQDESEKNVYLPFK